MEITKWYTSINQEVKTICIDFIMILVSISGNQLYQRGIPKKIAISKMSINQIVKQYTKLKHIVVSINSVFLGDANLRVTCPENLEDCRHLKGGLDSPTINEIRRKNY